MFLEFPKVLFYISFRSGAFEDLQPPTTDHLLPTTYQLTNQPPITSQPNTDQMHQLQINRPPTSKNFEDQKKLELISDINYDFKT